MQDCRLSNQNNALFSARNTPLNTPPQLNSSCFILQFTVVVGRFFSFFLYKKEKENIVCKIDDFCFFLEFFELQF